MCAPDLLPNEIGKLVSDEIADTGNLKVSVRILRQDLRVRRVVALLSEDGGEAVCPDLLHAWNTVSYVTFSSQIYGL